jgi:hypothetical protein
MWWCVRLLRSYNNSRDAAACGVQYHKFIFDRILEAFVHFLIMQLCATTDVKNQQGATFTTWLKQLAYEETNPTTKLSLTAIQAEYNTFCASPIYQGIKTRRDKAYAHIDQDRHTAYSLPGNTYGDLFGSVQKLTKIYDKVAALGKTITAIWSGGPDTDLYNTVADNIDMSPEDLMHEFMVALEVSVHDHDWHQELNRRSPTFE